MVLAPPDMKTVTVTCTAPHPDLKKDTAWARENKHKLCGMAFPVMVEEFYNGPVAIICPRCRNVAVFR